MGYGAIRIRLSANGIWRSSECAAWPKYGHDKVYLELQEILAAAEPLDSIGIKFCSVVLNR